MVLKHLVVAGGGSARGSALSVLLRVHLIDSVALSRLKVRWAAPPGRRFRSPGIPFEGIFAMLFAVGCSFPDYQFEAGVSDGSLTTTGAGGSFVAGGSSGIGGTESNTSGGGSGTDSGASATSVGGAGGALSSGGTGATSGTSGGAGSGGANGGSGGIGGVGGSGGSAVGSGGAATASGGVGGSGATAGSGGGGTGGTGGTSGEGECGNDMQCTSGQCDDGWCRPGHCGNGVMDPYETDTDCGGPECRACGYDQACQSGDDCVSGRCSTQDKCAATLVVMCTCSLDGGCNPYPASTPVNLQLRNDGDQRVMLADLTFHYYYSSESQSGTDQVSCTAMNFSGGSCSVFMGQSLETDFEDPSASHEIEFYFGAGWVDPATMSGAMLFTIEGNGPYQRGNDYSYQGVRTDAVFEPCENVVVTAEDGVPLWGRLPE